MRLVVIVVVMGITAVIFQSFGNQREDYGMKRKRPEVWWLPLFVLTNPFWIQDHMVNKSSTCCFVKYLTGNRFLEIWRLINWVLVWSHRACSCSVTSQAAASLPHLRDTQNSFCTLKEPKSTLFRSFTTARRHWAQRGFRVPRISGPRKTPGERGAGLPSFVGVGFCFLPVSRTISALQGEISLITQSRPWI